MPAGLVSIHKAQTSSSEDAVLTTNYLDDYIVRGNIFNISLAQELTADTSVYFTSEFSDPSVVNAVFLLPIELNPVSGYCTLYIYEETDYTGGTALTKTNRNRTSSRTANITVLGGASGTTKGDLIFTGIFGTAATGGFFGGSSGGGSGSSANSLILDKTKKYLYELVNSEDAVVGISAEFAEI